MTWAIGQHGAVCTRHMLQNEAHGNCRYLYLCGPGWWRIRRPRTSGSRRLALCVSARGGA